MRYALRNALERLATYSVSGVDGGFLEWIDRAKWRGATVTQAMAAAGLQPRPEVEAWLIRQGLVRKTIDGVEIGLFRPAPAVQAQAVPEAVEEVQRTQPWGKITLTLGTTLAAAEREVILQTLVAHRGNKTAAAETLGTSRQFIAYKLTEYGLEGPSTR